MIDLKFYKIIKDSTITIDYIYNNPNLKKLLSLGTSIFDIYTYEINNKYKNKYIDIDEVNNFYRVFFVVYIIPHTLYFKK